MAESTMPREGTVGSSTADGTLDRRPELADAEYDEIAREREVTTEAADEAPRGTRRARLMLARIDPFSAMKVGLLVSSAIGLATVVMTAALWLLLSSMGVFDSVNELARTVIGENSGKEFDIRSFVGLSKIMPLSIVVSVVNVFLLTALATLGAFLYNIVASLVGGLHLTLTDD